MSRGERGRGGKGDLEGLVDEVLLLLGEHALDLEADLLLSGLLALRKIRGGRKKEGNGEKERRRGR